MTTRPEIPWRSDPPPAAEKVIGLTRYGVLTVGPVTTHEWDSGFIVCWQRCPSRPDNWDDLLVARTPKERK